MLDDACRTQLRRLKTYIDHHNSSALFRFAMRPIALFNIAYLPIFCYGARGKSATTFDDYHARSQASAPLRLDDASYDDLTAIPRNHSVVVLLTALEARFGCQLCRDFQPEWDLLGRSWAKGDKRGDSRTLLGTLDFTDGKVTFQKVLTNLNYPTR